jgi:hypothetical protein
MIADPFEDSSRGPLFPEDDFGNDFEDFDDDEGIGGVIPEDGGSVHVRETDDDRDHQHEADSLEDEEEEYMEEEIWRSREEGAIDKSPSRSSRSTADGTADFETELEEEDILDDDDDHNDGEVKALWEEVFGDDEDEELHDDEEEEMDDEERLLRMPTDSSGLLDRRAMAHNNGSVASLEEEDSNTHGEVSSTAGTSEHRSGSLGGGQRGSTLSVDGGSVDNSASVDFDLGSYDEMSSHSSDFDEPEDLEHACKELIALVHSNSDADEIIRRCDVRTLYTNLRRQHRHLVRKNPGLAVPRDVGGGETWDSLDGNVLMGGPFVTSDQRNGSHQHQETGPEWGPNADDSFTEEDAFESTDSGGRGVWEESTNNGMGCDAANQLPFTTMMTVTASSTMDDEPRREGSQRPAAEVSDDEGGDDDSPHIEKWLERHSDDPKDYVEACRRLSAIIYQSDEDNDIDTLLRRNEPEPLYRYLKQQYWYLVHSGQIEETKLHNVSELTDDTHDDEKEESRWKDIAEAELNPEIEAMLVEKNDDERSSSRQVQPTKSQEFRQTLTESLHRPRNETLPIPTDTLGGTIGREISLTDSRVDEEVARMAAESTDMAMNEVEKIDPDVEARLRAGQELLFELQCLKEEEARLLAEDARLKDEVMMLQIGQGANMDNVDSNGTSDIYSVSLPPNNSSLLPGASMLDWTYSERTDEIDERTQLLERSGLLIREMSSESIIETDEEDESSSHEQEVLGQQVLQSDDNSLPVQHVNPEDAGEARKTSETVGDVCDTDDLEGSDECEFAIRDQNSHNREESSALCDDDDAYVEELVSEDGLRRQERYERYTREYNDLMDRQDTGEDIDENRLYLLELAVRKRLDEELTSDELRKLENFDIEEVAFEPQNVSTSQTEMDQQNETADAWQEVKAAPSSLSAVGQYELSAESTLASDMKTDGWNPEFDDESVDFAALDTPDSERNCFPTEGLSDFSKDVESNDFDESFPSSAHLEFSGGFDEDESRASTSSLIDSRTPKEQPPRPSCKDPVELEWRKKKIEDDLDDLVEKAEEQEIGDLVSSDARTALYISALKVSLVKKFYDAKKDKYSYYPSVAKCIFDYSLIEEAEKYYMDGSEEFPLDYSTALCTIAASQLKGNADEVDENASYVKKMTVDVCLDEELEESVESARRKSMIEGEIATLILDAEQQELDKTFTPDVYLALKHAALQVAYVKKYFDSENNEYVYFPSVAKCTYNFSLIEAAERYLRQNGGDEIDHVYTNALCTVAASYLRGNVKEVNEDDDLVKSHAVDVDLGGIVFLADAGTQNELTQAEKKSLAPTDSIRERQTELEKREEMILEQLAAIIHETEETDIVGTIEEEAVRALKIGAVKLALVKKYFDVILDVVVYFPSVARIILNYSLLEEAERHYCEGESDLPAEYTSGLRAAAARAIEKGDVDETDEYVINMAIDVEMEQKVEGESLFAEVQMDGEVEDKPDVALDVALDGEIEIKHNIKFEPTENRIGCTEIKHESVGAHLLEAIDAADSTSGSHVMNTINASQDDERMVMVKKELNKIIARAEKSELEEPLDSEAVVALNIAALEVCYQKKYYDALNDNFVYFPSVARTFLDYSLIEAAEGNYHGGMERFPSAYTASLRAIASETLDDGGHDYDHFEKLAVPVDEIFPINGCHDGEAVYTVEAHDADASWQISVHDEVDQDIEITIDDVLTTPCDSTSSLQAIQLVSETNNDGADTCEDKTSTLVRTQQIDDTSVVERGELVRNGDGSGNQESMGSSDIPEDVRAEEVRLKEMKQILEFKRRIDKQKISDDARSLEEMKKQSQRTATEDARLLDEEKKVAETRLKEEASLLFEKWLDDERQIDQALHELATIRLSEQQRLEAESAALEKKLHQEEERIERETKEIEEQRLADVANFSQRDQVLRAKLPVARKNLESERKLAEDEAKLQAFENEPKDEKNRGFFGFGGKNRKQDLEKEKQRQARLMEMKLRELEIEKEIQEIESEQARIKDQAEKRERERAERRARLDEESHNLENLVFSVSLRIEGERQQLQSRFDEQQTLLMKRKTDSQLTRLDDEKWLASETDKIQVDYIRSREQLARAAIERRETELQEEERLNRLAVALKERWVKDEEAFATEVEAFERNMAGVNRSRAVLDCKDDEHDTGKHIGQNSEFASFATLVASSESDVAQSDRAMGPASGNDLIEPLRGLLQTDESGNKEYSKKESRNQSAIQQPLGQSHEQSDPRSFNGAREDTLQVSDQRGQSNRVTAANHDQIESPPQGLTLDPAPPIPRHDEWVEAEDSKDPVGNTEDYFEEQLATFDSVSKLQTISCYLKEATGLSDKSSSSELPSNKQVLPDGSKKFKLCASHTDSELSSLMEGHDVETTLPMSVPGEMVVANQSTESNTLNPRSADVSGSATGQEPLNRSPLATSQQYIEFERGCDADTEENLLRALNDATSSTSAKAFDALEPKHVPGNFLPDAGLMSKREDTSESTTPGTTPARLDVSNNREPADMPEAIQPIAQSDKIPQDAIRNDLFLAATFKSADCHQNEGDCAKDYATNEDAYQGFSRNVPDHLVMLNQPKSPESYDRASIKSLDVFENPTEDDLPDKPILAAAVKAKTDQLTKSFSMLEGMSLTKEDRLVEDLSRSVPDHLLVLNQPKDADAYSRSSILELELFDDPDVDTPPMKPLLGAALKAKEDQMATPASVIHFLLPADGIRHDDLCTAVSDHSVAIDQPNSAKDKESDSLPATNSWAEEQGRPLLGLALKETEAAIDNERNTETRQDVHNGSTPKRRISPGVGLGSRLLEQAITFKENNQTLSQHDEIVEVVPGSTSQRTRAHGSSAGVGVAGEDAEMLNDFSIPERLSWWKINGKEMVAVHLHASPTNEKEVLLESLLLHNKKVAEARARSAGLNVASFDCQANDQKMKDDPDAGREPASDPSTPNAGFSDENRNAREPREDFRIGSQSVPGHEPIEGSNEHNFRKARESVVQRVKAVNISTSPAPIGNARAMEWAKEASGSPVSNGSNEHLNSVSVAERLDWWRKNGKSNENVEPKISPSNGAFATCGVQGAVPQRGPIESPTNEDPAGRKAILAEKRRQVVEARRAVKAKDDDVRTTLRDREILSGANFDDGSKAPHASTDEIAITNESVATGTGSFGSVLSPDREKECVHLDEKRKKREAEARRLAERTQRARESRLALEVAAAKAPTQADTVAKDQISQAAASGAIAVSVASEETLQAIVSKKAPPPEVDVSKKAPPPPALLYPMIREADRLSGFIRRYENKLKTACQSLLTVAAADDDEEETIAAKELSLPDMLGFIHQQDWYKANSTADKSSAIPHLMFSSVDRINGASSTPAIPEAMGKVAIETPEDKRYTVTPMGKAFLRMDGPMQADVGRFLTQLDHCEDGLNRRVMAEQWKDIARLSGDVQSQRVCDKLDELISFCMDSQMIK